MEYDRTGAMLRDFYNSCSCVMGGIFCLVFLGGFGWVAHEILLPSGRDLPTFMEVTLEGGRGQ